MLKLISLWTLNRIFERAKAPLSGMCKMVYINCLMYHFEKLEATTENSIAFEIFDTELDYEKFEKYFVELHKAGLVIIKEKSIYFENHWGQFIDRSQLSKSDTGEYVNATWQNRIDCYEEELRKSTTLKEHVIKNQKLSEKQYQEHINSFIEEQKAIGKTYNDYKDVSSHLFYWIGKRQTNPQQKAKSNKILGL
jgi:hypothetical protein